MYEPLVIRCARTATSYMLTGLLASANAATILLVGFALVKRGFVPNAAWLLAGTIFLPLFARFSSQLLPDVSPLIPIIGAGSMYLIGATLIAKRVTLKARVEPALIFLLLFLLWAILSLQWSANPELGMERLAVLALRGVLPGIAIYAAVVVFGEWRWRPVLVVGAVYCLLLLIAPEPGARASAFGANPIYDGRAAVVYAGIGLLQPRMATSLRLAIIVSGVLAAIATGSRGPIAALLLVHAGAGLVSVARAKRLFRLGRLQVVFALLVLLALAATTLSDRTPAWSIGDSRFVQATRLALRGDDPNTAGRIELASNASAAIARSPWIGAGAGASDTLFGSYPHNLVLEIAVEQGVVGLVLWLGFVLSAFFGMSARYRALFATTVLFTLFSGHVGSNLEYVVMAFVGISITKAAQRCPLSSPGPLPYRARSSLNRAGDAVLRARSCDPEVGGR